MQGKVTISEADGGYVTITVADEAGYNPDVTHDAVKQAASMALQLVNARVRP